MTLLLREVGRFLVEGAAWIGLVTLVAAGPALIAEPLARRSTFRRLLGLGFVGAAVAAALAVRFSLPLAWAPLIGGRPLPVAWSLTGAAAAVAAEVALRVLLVAPRDAAASRA